MSTKEERLEIVNKIMKEISDRSRRFFHYNGKIAHLSIIKGKLYYHYEHSDDKCCISIPEYKKPKGWNHGGTLWGLVKDFRDYINSGNDTNGEYGYGGLFCTHWGYSKEDMIAIQQKAFELGYLKSIIPYRN